MERTIHYRPGLGATAEILQQAEPEFKRILVEVRMSAALGYLQSTDRSVTQIALAVGYESASRFAIRFHERFGFAPSTLRNQPGPELRLPTRMPDKNIIPQPLANH